jgi:hypothetical protein
MGKTLQQGFEQFLLTKLAPVPSEYNLARSHKNSVKKSIKNHIVAINFGKQAPLEMIQVLGITAIPIILPLSLKMLLPIIQKQC